MGVRRMVLALWVAVALLGTLTAWNVQQIQTGRAEGKAQQARFNQAATDSLRTVLCLAENAVLTSKAVSPEQRRNAIYFYESALVKIHARSC